MKLPNLWTALTFVLAATLTIVSAKHINASNTALPVALKNTKKASTTINGQRFRHVLSRSTTSAPVFVTDEVKVVKYDHTRQQDYVPIGLFAWVRHLYRKWFDK